MENFSKIADILNMCENVVIAAHTNPDADAIGSCLGLALGLKKLGKKPVVVLEKYNKKFDIIPGKQFVFKGDIHSLDPDTFIALDCGSADRLGEAQWFLQNTKTTVNIDHHLSGNNFAEYNYIGKDVSSTSEIILKILERLVELDEEIGAALYAGMVSDTGGFRHQSTTEETYRAAALLVSLGVPFSQIYNQIMCSHSLLEAKALAQSIQRVTKIEGLPVNFSYMLAEDLREINASLQDLGGICEYILGIDNAEIAVFIYPKRKNTFKISIRSTELPINGIAQSLGGGGHALAAGADFVGTFQEAQDTVIKLLKNELRKND